MNYNENETLWCEKYRPRKVEDCVLPPRLKAVFQQYVDSASVPNLMLSGSAGVGKTTVAKALCDEIGLNYMFINSSEERGIDVLRTKIIGYASTMSLTGGKKVIILDEADGLTSDAQDALRGAIEAFSSNCTFILTCNFKAKLKESIHSRCAVIDFTLKKDEKPRMAVQLLHRLEQILKLENVEYDKQVLAKIVEKHFPDYRRTIGELQRYSATGKIDAGILVQVSDLQDMKTLVDALRDKDFSKMRKWVTNNSDIDPVRVYRQIYDALSGIMKPHSIPQAVVIIGKYQYQAAFVADAEINLVAMLTELMVDCEFV